MWLILGNLPLELHRLPSIRPKSIGQRDSKYHFILFFQASTGLSLRVPRLSTESANTEAWNSQYELLYHTLERFSPHKLLPVNRGQSGNFCLIFDQPLSRLNN